MHRKLVCTVTAALLLSLAGSALGQPGIDGWWTETIGGGTAGNATIKTGTYTVTGDGADIWGDCRSVPLPVPTTHGRRLHHGPRRQHRHRHQHLGQGRCHDPRRQLRRRPAWHEHRLRQQRRHGRQRRLLSVATHRRRHVVQRQLRRHPAAAAPYWTKIERIGNQFSAFLSADGQTWTQTGTTQTIAMTDPVLIGLCVTSHVAGTLRTYTFDNVSYTGNVTPRPPQTKADESESCERRRRRDDAAAGVDPGRDRHLPQRLLRHERPS